MYLQFSLAMDSSVKMPPMAQGLRMSTFWNRTSDTGQESIS